MIRLIVKYASGAVAATDLPDEAYKEVIVVTNERDYIFTPTGVEMKTKKIPESERVQISDLRISREGDV